MAVDWLGFTYAAAIVIFGFVGYKRKGSVMSLIAGLLFGSLSGYGALKMSLNPRDVTISLAACASLAVIMGVRYLKSRKLMPAGIVTGVSLLMLFRLLINSVF